MLALSALAAASEEQRAQVQTLTLSATPPSYRQLVADRRQKVLYMAISATPVCHSILLLPVPGNTAPA